jgi:hypothetical protein
LKKNRPRIELIEKEPKKSLLCGDLVNAYKEARIIINKVY